MRQTIMLLRGVAKQRRGNLLFIRRLLRHSLQSLLAMTLLISCAPVDLNAQIPSYDTGIDPNAWAQIPAGEFFYG